MAENKDPLQYRRSLVVQPKVSTQFNQFLPTKDKSSSYVPAPLRKKRAERNDDNRRSWGDSLDEEEVKPFSRSKSLSDIVSDPSVLQQVRFEEIQKMRERIKENEDMWQDDLTKWKNRRRSVNSDIMRKKEEREQIENLTSDSSTRRVKTFKEMKKNRKDNMDGNSMATFSATDSLVSSVTSQPQVPLTRDNTEDSHDVFYTPSNDTGVHKKDSQISGHPIVFTRSSSAHYSHGENRHVLVKPLDPAKTATSLVQSNQQGRDPGTVLAKVNPISVDSCPFSTSDSTRNTYQSTTSKSRKTHAVPDDLTSSTIEEQSSKNTSGMHSASTVLKAPELKTKFGRLSAAQSDFQQNNTAETKPGASQTSTSFPWGYQQSKSLRLTSVVTPRPFGAQSSRISSMSRSYTMDDAHKNYNGERAQKTFEPSQYKHPSTAEDVTGSRSISKEEEEKEEEEMEEEELNATVSSEVCTSNDIHEIKECYSDMRVSLNQRPNSSRDFGFQSSWDSTGAFVKTIQPGSTAELCHLQVGDEILTVNGQQVSDMSFNGWKGSMEAALQQGNLVMDVRRYGKNNWSRDLPSLPYNSHKTINLTSMDPKHGSTNKDITSLLTSETTIKNTDNTRQPVSGLASKETNCSVQKEFITVTDNELEPISLKNFKRRSEFFETQGGPEMSTSNQVQAPSLRANSSRWSWNPEEDRQRQEKWQKEQQRALQEKYEHDKKLLQEQWSHAQREAIKQDVTYSMEKQKSSVNNTSSRAALPTSAHQQENLQEVQKIRTKSEETEWKRKEQSLTQQKLQGENREEGKVQKDLKTEKPQTQLQSRVYELSDMHPEISVSHREKSKSSPELDEINKQDEKAKQNEISWNKDTKSGKESLSQTELERQQILQEMRKTTQVLTDGSWIRQQNSSADQKEPVSLVEPIRRGASLDNLDESRSWRQSWSSGPSQSFSRNSRPQSMVSTHGYMHTSSSTMPSSISPFSFHTPPVGHGETSSSSQQTNRSISGKKICTFCNSPLGKGAAMIIETLGLCFHLNCFKCIQCKADLGGSDVGAEVRIRNKMLYCNSCYIQLKAGQPTPM